MSPLRATQHSLHDYVGRKQIETDHVVAAPIKGLAALLDRDDVTFEDGAPIPPGSHWLYFLPLARQSLIDVDGHPRRGNFLPPIELPRRMWAGGRLAFHQPLRIGDRITRASTILKIEEKSGRSGRMVFVTVESTVSGERGLAVSEEQDIVYRDRPTANVTMTPTAPEPARAEPQARSVIRPTPTMLFRFSALTFNAHRIHYDRDYTRGHEGYPDLVVQGPLTATLLLNLLRQTCSGRNPRKFQFRGQQPIFADRDFELTLHKVGENEVSLRALTPDGRTAMLASAELDS